MDINLIAFPWITIKGYYDEKRLGTDELINSEEYDQLWDDSPDTWERLGDSYQFYHGVYSDTAALKQGSAFETREELVAFSNTLVNEEYQSDLPVSEQDDCLVAAFSPEKVSELAKIASKINFGAVEAAHREIEENGLRFDGLDEPVQGVLEVDTKGYVAYLSGLAEFVKEVDGQQRGIVIHMG